ncbi:Cyclase-like protein 2 [Linum perenne]
MLKLNVLVVLPLLLLSILAGDAASTRRTGRIGSVPPPVRREVYGYGRLFDITHRVRPDLPKFGQAGGVGHLLRLVESMANGSTWNEGEINRMGTHTGTHVDTPGHFYQEYYEAGYDVDSLDLDVLNGGNVAVPQATSREGSVPPPVRREVYGYGHVFDITHKVTPDLPKFGQAEGVGQLLRLVESMENGSTWNEGEIYRMGIHTGTHVDAPGHFYQEYYEAGYDVDSLDLDVLNATDGRRIIDITHSYVEEMPAYGSEQGMGKFLRLISSMKNGSDANMSEFKMSVHSGTHLDSPAHFYDNYFDAGFDVDTLDLEVLNGPALLVDVPRDSNITAKVMKSLQIPKGTRRVLFRTLNTDRRLMFKKEFDSSFVGFMADGAQWLVDNTDIKLVGVDYLSAAAFVNAAPSHLAFLKNREIILVEALKLDNVEAGLYNVHCLPLRLVGAEGSPARCILIK